MFQFKMFKFSKEKKKMNKYSAIKIKKKIE